MPNGIFENEDYIDHDGLNPRIVRACVKITIEDDHLIFDFTGSDPQMPGSRNMVWNATLAGVYYAVKAMIDPDLPPNAGYFRTVEVIAPEGTIFNALTPAAVGDRGSSGNILGDLIESAETGSNENLARFLGSFYGLAETSVASLREWAQRSAGGEPGSSGLARHLRQASDRWARAVEGLTRRRIEVQLTGLDFREIEDVVDNGQERLAGTFDHLQGLALLDGKVGV